MIADDGAVLRGRSEKRPARPSQTWDEWRRGVIYGEKGGGGERSDRFGNTIAGAAIIRRQSAATSQNENDEFIRPARYCQKSCSRELKKGGVSC
jgi:hypothetical protein